MSDLDRVRAHILRSLKIDEVSSVDKGAGDGCRVVLYKRDDTAAPANGGDDDEAFREALHYLMHTAQGASVVRRFFGPGGTNDTADIEHLARLVARGMREEASNSDDVEPSDPQQPWADTIGDATETEKVHSMDRDEVLKGLVRRDGGIVGLCKRICKQGAGDISEHELTALITEHAMREHPDMSPDHAFTKAYMSPAGEPLRRAVQITKGMLQPVQVGGNDVDANDATAAYESLQKLAVDMRKRSPFLSTSQAFERVSKQRPDLLARAVPRR
jgi:hypothetical protein